jgi:hypothetical protein
MRRRLEGVYWALAAAGAALPLAAFVPWFAVHGADPSLFAAELFANRISSFFAFDVIVSAIVLTLFVLVQGARDRVAGRWWAIAGTFCIGVSFGLPLFLALRERSRG